MDVDPLQDDKAKEIAICSFRRPHMRAFHCAWWGFFIAFFVWFSISPLLPQIKEDLNLTDQEIWTSSIASVSGTIVMRFALGPLCDVFGARILFSIVLCTAAIPTALTGLVQSARGLILLRAFIGIAGGTFVMCQYWSSRMFSKQVVGTANALVGGWGNVGAGVTQLAMGSILFPIFESLTGDKEIAWRSVCLVPAIVAFVSGIVIYHISDDSPKGNYSELKANGVFRPVTVRESFSKACFNPNAWILFVQYACCFGVELTMNLAAANYFRDEFDQSTAAASAITAIFGWLNLFARGLGGFLSDVCNYKAGMRGRIWAQTICLALEGALVFAFYNTKSLGGSIVALVFFSLVVQATEGTTYGMVPYVDPPRMGSITGIVGAGGNVGAMVFGFCFRELQYDDAFLIMAACILGSSLLSVFIRIPGHSTMFNRTEAEVNPETGEIVALLYRKVKKRPQPTNVDKLV